MWSPYNPMFSADGASFAGVAMSRCVCLEKFFGSTEMAVLRNKWRLRLQLARTVRSFAAFPTAWTFACPQP